MHLRGETVVNNTKAFTAKDFFYKYGIYIIFVLLLVVFSFSNANFLTADNILMILKQAAPLGIAVTGMVFVLILAGIDISAGQNMFLSAYVVAVFVDSMSKAGVDPSSGGVVFGAIALALLVGAGIGSLNGFLIARFNMVPFIVTLATQGIARGLALLISNSKVMPIAELGKIVNTNVFGVVPVVIIILAVVIFLFDFLLRRTPFGRRLMAIGNDKIAAANIGLKVRKNTFMAYLICGILCALAGVLSAAQISTVAPTFANGNEFIVISSAVLGGVSLFGGKGNIFPGALIGIILVTTIVNGLTMMNADPYIYTIVRGLIIFVAVMLDSVNYKGRLS